MKEYKVRVVNVNNRKTKVIIFDGNKVVGAHNVKKDTAFEWMTMTEEQYLKAKSKLMHDGIKDQLEACKIPMDNITAFAASEISADNITATLSKGINIEGVARQKDVNKLAKRVEELEEWAEDFGKKHELETWIDDMAKSGLLDPCPTDLKPKQSVEDILAQDKWHNK